MSRNRTPDLQTTHIEPPAPHTASLAAPEATDETQDDAISADERNFFEYLLEIYDEDPERWDGLE